MMKCRQIYFDNFLILDLYTPLYIARKEGYYIFHIKFIVKMVSCRNAS